MEQLDRHPFSNDRIGDLTIGDLLTRSANAWPDQEALVHRHQPLIDSAQWTYSELERDATRLARGLLADGCAPGDHVAIYAPNHPEWILLEYALAKAGLVLVALNPLYKAEELDFTLTDSRVKALFYADRIGGQEIAPLIDDVRRRTPLLRWAKGLADGIPSLMHNAPSDIALPTVDAAKAAMIQYTSGTTGTPKAVYLSHKAIVTTAANSYRIWGVKEQSRVCHGFPLFHVGGSGNSTPGAALRGATTLPLYIFKAEATLDILERERCTHFIGVPTMLVAMLEHPSIASRDFSQLGTIIVGGAPVSSALIKKCKDVFGAELLNGYGQTETCGVTSTTRFSDSIEKKTATSGTPIEGVSVEIRDASGARVKAGMVGEVHYNGPGRMLGYHSGGAALQSADGDAGWIASGDLGIIDEDGYLTITGRAKEMIIRGGENLSPVEIEGFLRNHAAVLDAAVVGVRDEKYGEEVCAAVRIAPNHDVTPEAIRAWCAERVSRWKVPKYVVFVEQFPSTASGKVKKHILREDMERVLGISAAQ